MRDGETTSLRITAIGGQEKDTELGMIREFVVRCR